MVSLVTRQSWSQVTSATADQRVQREIKNWFRKLPRIQGVCGRRSRPKGNQLWIIQKFSFVSVFPALRGFPPFWKVKIEVKAGDWGNTEEIGNCVNVTSHLLQCVRSDRSCNCVGEIFDRATIQTDIEVHYVFGPGLKTLIMLPNMVHTCLFNDRVAYLCWR